MIITKEDLEQKEKRFRTKLINSLAGVRQAVLVGTRAENGLENLAIFNSLIHLGASPALFGLVSRPDSVQRDTLENIRRTGSYTLNFIHQQWVGEAHQTSARYGKEVSEFKEAGFTPYYEEGTIAPFVGEAIIKIEMKMQQILPIEINNTMMVIGSVEKIIAPAERIADDGLVIPNDLLLSAGLDAYYSAGFLVQMPYAKP